MNLVAVIERMEAQGMEPGAILAAVKCMAAEQDAAIQRRRCADRERQAKHRAKVDCHVTSRDVTVTECDNPPPLVPPLSPAPLSPPIIPPTRSGLLVEGRELEAKLREAAGWQNEPHPNLFVTGPIETLLSNGADLETDVLPVVRGRARNVRRPSGWNYFVGPIQDAVQARIAAGTGPPQAGEVVPFKATSTRNSHGPRPQTIAAGFDLINREIERREREIAEAESRLRSGADNPQALS